MRIHVHPINLDTSILISILPSEPDSKPFFTLLLDPWLSGTSITYHSRFSTQGHTLPPLLPSLSNLPQPPSAVLISQNKSDHCSRETLTQLPDSTPIYAVPGAYELVKSWNHFLTVHRINDWKKNGGGKDLQKLELPEGRGLVEVRRLPCRLWEMPMLHSFLSIRILPSEQAQGKAPSAHILYTPHGAPPNAVLPYLQTLAEDERKITLLFHPTTQVKLPFWLGGNVMTGAPGLEKVLQSVEVEGVVAVHDEEKELGGVVGWFVKNIEDNGKVAGKDIWRMREGGWGFDVEGGRWKSREMDVWSCCGPKELELRDEDGKEDEIDEKKAGIVPQDDSRARLGSEPLEDTGMMRAPLPVSV